MEERVNISKVAKDLNLSVSTVSRALSGKGRVSRETKHRVQEYLRKYKLEPNSRGKRTRAKSGCLAIVLPAEQTEAACERYQALMVEALRIFTAAGYRSFVVLTEKGKLDALYQLLEEEQVDGVLFTRYLEEETKEAKRMGIPFVTVGDSKSEICTVSFDEEKAAETFTNELLRQNLMSIAVLTAENNTIKSAPAYRGIVRALTGNYLILDRNRVFYGIRSESDAITAVEKCLSMKVDVICCMDDWVCRMVQSACARMKLNIPRDIQLASLHSSREFADSMLPVSCIWYDVHQLGQEAARLLLEQLSEELPVRKIRIGYELHMKSSKRRI